MDVLSNFQKPLQTLVILCVTGLKTKADIEKGVKHIIADIIAKDKEIMDVMRKR